MSTNLSFFSAKYATLRLYQQISHYYSAKYATLSLYQQISHYYIAKYATLRILVNCLLQSALQLHLLSGIVPMLPWVLPSIAVQIITRVSYGLLWSCQG